MRKFVIHLRLMLVSTANKENGELPIAKLLMLKLFVSINLVNIVVHFNSGEYGNFSNSGSTTAAPPTGRFSGLLLAVENSYFGG